MNGDAWRVLCGAAVVGWVGVASVHCSSEGRDTAATSDAPSAEGGAGPTEPGSADGDRPDSSESGQGDASDVSQRPGPPPGPGATCVTSKLDTTTLPIYMVIVLDGSAKMDGWTETGAVLQEVDPDPTATPGRVTGIHWLGTRTALRTFVDRAQASADRGLGLGLYLMTGEDQLVPPYPDPRPAAVAPFKFVDEWDVSPALVDAAQGALFKARFAPPVVPAGLRPLVEVMRGQVPLLQAFDPARSDSGTGGLFPGGQRVLVVISAGIPDWGAPPVFDGGPSPANPQKPLHECSAIAKAAFSAATLTTPAATYDYQGKPPITTYAIGLGDPESDPGYDPRFLGELATAGGSAPRGCDPTWTGKSPSAAVPCYTQVTPSSTAQVAAGILAALDAIRSTASACDLMVVQGDAGALDPAYLNVVYTPKGGAETLIAEGATNGWTLGPGRDPMTVQLHGAACDTLRQNPGAVRLVVGCRTGGLENP